MYAILRYVYASNIISVKTFTDKTCHTYIQTVSMSLKLSMNNANKYQSILSITN